MSARVWFQIVERMREKEFKKGYWLKRQNDFSLDQAKYNATVILMVETKPRDRNLGDIQWKTL